MPGLQYLPRVFDAFVADETGELCVAEIDGAIVGCGKFTLVPDGSAWLETLRVIPAYQGLGVGKRLYERFFELAERTGSPTLRMYTGLSNVVSKGLAERFGFRLAGTYRGAWQACGPAAAPLTLPAFHQITDPDTATALLMPFHDKWAGFLVMNRTFYALTPALCADLAQKGMVYAEPSTTASSPWAHASCRSKPCILGSSGAMWRPAWPSPGKQAWNAMWPGSVATSPHPPRMCRRLCCTTASRSRHRI